MPQYEWEGRTLNGETKRGLTKAISVNTLRAGLRKDGIILTKSAETKGSKAEKYNPKKGSKNFILFFLRDSCRQ